MTISQDFVDKEEAAKRRPLQLFHLWQIGIDDWYLTDGDVSVDFGGETWTPATIDRGEVKYDGSVEANTLQITFNYLEDPINEYIMQTLVDEVWVEVLKLHRDQSPLESFSIFMGKVEGIVFKGTDAVVSCVGIKAHFRKVIPYYRYQSGCNHMLYDADTCKINKNSYKASATLSDVSADGLTLTSSTFGLQTDDYYAFGYMEIGNYKRMVVAHTENVVTLRYPIPNLAISDTVDIYAGCSRNIQICHDKFNNVSHFLGTPYIPWVNPLIRPDV